MHHGPGFNRAYAVLVLLVGLAAVPVGCGAGGTSGGGDGGSGPPPPTTCAACLAQAQGGIWLWCEAEHKCLEYPEPCSQPGGHGYLGTSSPGDLDALCALDCAVATEEIKATNGATLNATPCCSSSPLVSNQCAPSNAGEKCSSDDGCVMPEKCQGGVCVGKPYQPAVTCDVGDLACTCQATVDVDPKIPPACSTSVLTNSACCASDSWPGAGDCTCAELVCAQMDLGNCECAMAGMFPPGIPTQSSCSGSICCTDPTRDLQVNGCRCDQQPVPGETCANLLVGDMQVPSCTVNVIPCRSGYHSVSVCTDGTTSPM